MPPQTNFPAILNGMPQPYLMLDSGLIIVAASDAYLRLTDRTREDIVGRHILEAYPENPEAVGTVEQGPLEVSLRHVLKTAKPHEMSVIQYDIPQAGGGFTQKFWTPVHSPVLGANGQVEYIIQNPMDVTESVVKSREADARLRVALHAADLASWEYEPDTEIWRRSHIVDEIFGFEAGQGGSVAAPFFARMHPDDLRQVLEVVESVIGCPDQTVMNYDYRILLPSGETKYVASRGEVLRTSDGKVRMIGVLMDVTADREREAALAAAVKAQDELLRQKDLLLAEVNHRVKNSLQLVVSTLRLQARRLQDAETVQAFDQAISRVRAIVSVHERLYRNDNSLTVDMAAHLTKLCLDVVDDNGASPIKVRCDHIELPTERAIPISVIVNEFLLECLSSPHFRNGFVEVSLKRSDDQMLKMSLLGPTRKHRSKTDGADLGARIVKTMAAQIDGELTHGETDSGYQVMITFPEDVI